MSGARRAASIALALAAVLGGALSCAAQQLVYARDLDLVRRSSDNKPLQNIYWVSLPLLPRIADAADTLSPLPNKCVGDLDGPPAGDGLINADDIICAWWTARADRATAGTFTLYRPLTSRCTLDFRSATVALGTVRFLGSPFSIEEGDGLQVRITVHQGDTSSPRSHADIAGDPDPAFPGRPIVAMPDCGPGQVIDCCTSAATRLDLVSTPYNTLYRSADEILCGLEGVDWQDSNRDGRPDTCWNDANSNGRWDVGEATTGIFDARVAASVMSFDNSEAVNAPVARGASIQLGSLRFMGTRFDLRPGDAQLLVLSKAHSPTVYLPDVP